MFLFRTPTEPSRPPLNATAAGLDRVMNAIRGAAQTTGAGFDYLLRTARRESSLVPDAQASTSTARGLYQFIDQTWLTMVRDEGRRFGLERYADQISRDAKGRASVADPQARQRILALRDDPQVAALMAGAFTARNAAELRETIGRDPTEGELYMAHFLGAGGASRLIQAQQANPQASAARLFPDAADANRRIFFEQGRPRTVAEVYQVLAQGQNRPANFGATTAGTLVTTQAQAQADQTDYGTWGVLRRVNAPVDRPFHSLFHSPEGGINAFVSSTWGQFGATQIAQNAPTDTPRPEARPAGVGGPLLPMLVNPAGVNRALDLQQFLRPEARNGR